MPRPQSEEPVCVWENGREVVGLHSGQGSTSEFYLHSDLHVTVTEVDTAFREARVGARHLGRTDVHGEQIPLLFDEGPCRQLRRVGPPSIRLNPAGRPNLIERFLAIVELVDGPHTVDAFSSERAISHLIGQIAEDPAERWRHIEDHLLTRSTESRLCGSTSTGDHRVGGTNA